jgi:hypothetical protein
MLFRNPFPMNLYSAHRRAAKLAGMHSPLLSISVSGKNCLQVIIEAAVTWLYLYWHHSPISTRLDAANLSFIGTWNGMGGSVFGNLLPALIPSGLPPMSK